MSFQHERVRQGKISEATIPNYYKAVKLFCEMNDLVLNWKKITRGMPRVRQAANDRAPTIDEIQKLVEYPDRRIKPIVYIMASSGIRIGAWDYLRWKHVIPMTNNSGEIIAAKLIVYAGDREEYYAFITPEAYSSLKEWIDFRASYGEKITGESWVMRDIWQTTNIDYGAKWGLATNPKKLKSSGIKRLLERGLWEQGIRQPLAQGTKRHEWKAAHGFRKFYKSRAEQVMKPINVELTMGHNIGISASYYKPRIHEVLEDYLKAVDLLTIHGDKAPRFNSMGFHIVGGQLDRVISNQMVQGLGTQTYLLGPSSDAIIDVVFNKPSVYAPANHDYAALFKGQASIVVVDGPDGQPGKTSGLEDHNNPSNAIPPMGKNSIPVQTKPYQLGTPLVLTSDQIGALSVCKAETCP
jgi:integrase